jgi:hypothetical protein
LNLTYDDECSHILESDESESSPGYISEDGNLDFFFFCTKTIEYYSLIKKKKINVFLTDGCRQI